VKEMVEKQNAEDEARWKGAQLAPSPEVKQIREGPYKGFYASNGKPDPARVERCRRMAEEDMGGAR